VIGIFSRQIWRTADEQPIPREIIIDKVNQLQLDDICLLFARKHWNAESPTPLSDFSADESIPKTGRFEDVRVSESTRLCCLFTQTASYANLEFCNLFYIGGGLV